MVDRWEDEYPAEGAFSFAAPERQDIALSFAHKLIMLVTIVLLITGLWALTSQPISDVQTSDATLGPPIGSNTSVGTTQADVAKGDQG